MLGQGPDLGIIPGPQPLCQAPLATPEIPIIGKPALAAELALARATVKNQRWVETVRGGSAAWVDADRCSAQAGGVWKEGRCCLNQEPPLGDKQSLLPPATGGSLAQRSLNLWAAQQEVSSG